METVKNYTQKTYMQYNNILKTILWIYLLILLPYLLLINIIIDIIENIHVSCEPHNLV